MASRQGYLLPIPDLKAGGVPSTPPANYFRLYRRNSALIYLDDAGTEHQLVETSSSNLITVKEDFISAYLNGSVFEFVLATASGGTNALRTMEINPAGSARLGIFGSSITTANGSTANALMSTGLIRFGAGLTRLTIFLRLSGLSAVGDAYSLQFGFIDTNAAAQVDGVFFRYDSTNANFICVTSDNSVQTTANSGIAGNTNWNRYDIEINAAGTSAEFSINSAVVGTITTNIPTAAGRETSIGHRISRTAAGGAAKTAFFDSYELYMLTGAR
jgi:hypothetical protein